ncbi:MAG: Hpt domain-containing protein [Chloroflexota bacterium]
MSDPGVIDEAEFGRLLETVGGDREFLAELIETYLVDAPPLLADIRGSAAASNFDVLRRAAHTLKGTSASFGLVRLVDSCRVLEAAGAESSADGLDASVDAASSAYAEAETALRARLAATAPA